MMNIISVDYEEWYMVTSFNKYIKKDEWDKFESRLEFQTNKLLTLFDKYKTKATFFIVGKVARDNPELIRLIADKGHEIASHSDEHKTLMELGPEKFREDLIKSKNSLEELSGKKVKGYRAPSWSLNNSTKWAIEILKDCGFIYDSSIYPISVRYGWDKSERYMYSFENGLKEFPLSTVKILNKNYPVGGGMFLRDEPLLFTKYAIRKYEESNNPFIIYMHPWEIDPEHPKIRTNIKTRFIHYSGLKNTFKKLEKLLCEYKFTSFEDYIENIKN